MKTKKHVKNIMGMVGVGMLGGVGTQALSKVSPSSASALSGGMSMAMPIAGTMVGANMALDAMGSLKPGKKGWMK